MVSRHTLGSNQQSMKAQNRALILKLICTGEKVSRIELAKLTGLSKMSLTNIVNELISEGFVCEECVAEKPYTKNSPGRKPIFLSVNTEIYVALGLYISRDHAIAVAANLKSEIIKHYKCQISSDEAEASFTSKIKELIKNILTSEELVNKKILGIGISCIGPLDIKNGIILDPPNFHRLRSIPIKELLEKEFGIKAFLDNDMNASALAEKLYGYARNVSNFIYVGVTNGIGAGIVANNTLFQGHMGFSGEIGHVTINSEGPKCACGNIGCLELYASIPEIVEQARSSVMLGMESKLKELNTIEWNDIIENSKQNDLLSLNLIERMCFYISIGIVTLSNIFDPEIIYLGHEFALAGRQAAEQIENVINEKIISSKYKRIPVRISAFGEKAPIIGSASIIFNKLFNDGYVD